VEVWHDPRKNVDMPRAKASRGFIVMIFCILRENKDGVAPLGVIYTRIAQNPVMRCARALPAIKEEAPLSSKDASYHTQA